MVRVLHVAARVFVSLIRALVAHPGLDVIGVARAALMHGLARARDDRMRTEYVFGAVAGAMRRDVTRARERGRARRRRVELDKRQRTCATHFHLLYQDIRAPYKISTSITSYFLVFIDTPDPKPLTRTWSKIAHSIKVDRLSDIKHGLSTRFSSFSAAATVRRREFSPLDGARSTTPGDARASSFIALHRETRRARAR